MKTKGTETGTNSAVWHAKLVMGYHGKHTLIPKFKPNITLLCCLVNNQFFLVSPDLQTPQYRRSVATIYKNYTQDINYFLSLTWDTPPLRPPVNFLELHISIVIQGHIILNTFQNSMNLYLYLPPQSYHPSGSLQGLVFGILQRYW